MLGQLLQHRRAHVRLRVVQQLDQGFRGARPAHLLKPPQGDLAHQRVGIAEQLQQQAPVLGQGELDQLFGGPLALAGVGDGQAHQPARPPQYQRPTGHQPIAQGQKQLPLCVRGRPLQARVDLRQKRRSEPGQALAQRLGLGRVRLEHPVDLPAGVGQLLRRELLRLGRVDLDRLVGPRFQRGQPLLGHRLRQPRVEPRDGRLPGAQHFQGGKPRGEIALRQCLDHCRPRDVRMGGQPANGRLADRRVSLAQLPHQAQHAHRIGRTALQQAVVGPPARGLVVFRQPCRQGVGREAPVVRDHRPAGRRADPQRGHPHDTQPLGGPLRGGHVQVDQRPAGKLLLHLGLLNLRGKRPARRAPVGPHANQHRLPIGHRLALPPGQVRHPRQQLGLGLGLRRAGLLRRRHHRRQHQPAQQHAPSHQLYWRHQSCSHLSAVALSLWERVRVRAAWRPHPQPLSRRRERGA